MKRFIFVSFCILLIAAGAGVYLFRSVGASGSGVIEQWIGGQLQGMANAHLNPRLSFTDLDYAYPATVSLKNLRLTADDPANPGKTIDILGAGHATLTLAEVPQVGRPIVLESVVLDKPLFSIVAVKQGSAELVGFSHLVRPGSIATSQPASMPADKPSEPRLKLSDLLRMRLVELKDGTVVYDPRLAGTEPMTLDQINTTIKLAPDKDAGWHMLSLAIAREPLFNLSAAGQINLDNFNARDCAVKLIASINQEKLDYLPPQMQKLLREYDVRGSLYMVLTGELPIMHPLSGSADAEIKLTGANIMLGEYRIPVDDLSVNANFEDGQLALNTVRIAALKGVATITGTAQLNDVIDSDLKIQIKDMLLQELLAYREGAKPPKLAGKLNASVEAIAPLMVVLAKAAPPATTRPASYSRFASMPLPAKWGVANADLVDGRIADAPALAGLAGAFRAAAKIVNVKMNAADQPPKDRARITLEFISDRAQFSEITFVGDYLAGRGKGWVSLDRKLDLLVNAGPIEKVQEMLGAVGGAIGAVTDKLLAYRVTGTVSQPKVQVEVAGNAVTDLTKKTESAVEGGAKAVGEGVNKIGEGIGNLLRGGKN